MKNNTMVNIFLGVAILLVGAGAIFIWHQGEQDKAVYERAEMYLQSAKLEADQKERQQKRLEECLSEADSNYDTKLELNSVEVTTPEGDKARQWNNADVAERAEDNYRKDKEFCLKLYK